MNILLKQKYYRIFFRLSFAGLILLFFINSCDPLHVYEKNKEIPDRKWSKNNAVAFDVKIEDTEDIYNMYINIRHTSDYPFRNIIFFVKTIGPRGTVANDTVEYMLADKKGKWYGGGLGGVYFAQMPFKKNIRFPYTGVYRFELVQGMRKDALNAVRDVGIRIERSRVKRK